MIFSQEGVFVLDSWFFADEAWFQSSGYINSQTEKYGVLKTHMHCMQILCICQNRVLVHSVSEKKIVGTYVVWL